MHVCLDLLLISLLCNMIHVNTIVTFRAACCLLMAGSPFGSRTSATTMMMSAGQCISEAPNWWNALWLAFSPSWQIVTLRTKWDETPIPSICNDQTFDMIWSIIKWKHFPRYWPFVRGIHRSPVNSPHKGQWRGALMFSLICTWTNDWVNNQGAGDLRCHHAL